MSKRYIGSGLLEALIGKAPRSSKSHFKSLWGPLLIISCSIGSVAHAHAEVHISVVQSYDGVLEFVIKGDPLAIHSVSLNRSDCLLKIYDQSLQYDGIKMYTLYKPGKMVFQRNEALFLAIIERELTIYNNITKMIEEERQQRLASSGQIGERSDTSIRDENRKRLERSYEEAKKRALSTSIKPTEIKANTGDKFAISLPFTGKYGDVDTSCGNSLVNITIHTDQGDFSQQW